MALQHVVLACHNHTLSAGPEAGGATVIDDVFSDPDDEAESQKTRPEIVTMLVTIHSNEFSKNAVELRGFEPLTFCMPCRRATSCAIAPQPPQDARRGPPRKVERS